MALYDKHKEAFDKLERDGFPNLKEAAKWFNTTAEFDHAIGFNNACHHWVSGRPASPSSDRRAKVWLDLKRSHQSLQPIANPAPAQAPSGVVLMVVATAENAARAKKMLQILGCEVEEI